MSKFALLLACVAVWVGICPAQIAPGTHHVQAAPMIAPQVAAVVQQMASQAGVIFAGHVVAVARDEAKGFVDIQFGVDQAVRGTVGSTYTLREWAGRWVGRPDRYRVGQRFLMMLAAAGPQGISAPVCGEDGAIPLLGVAAAAVAGSDGAIPADTGSAEWAVDLRRLSTSALRGGASVVKADSAGTADGWAGPAAPLLVDGQDGTTLLPPMSLVVGLLGAAHAAQ